MDLFQYTYDLVRQIPDGKVSTYGAVARALGDIRASRAVGLMMNQNPDADDMPCYKIVYSDGRLGGFGLGINDKIRRLKQDNINVKDGKIVEFNHAFFDEFQTDHPLKNLRQEQIKHRKRVNVVDGFNKIETVAGLDISYPKNAFDDACAACVIMDYKTKQIIEKKTIFSKTFFPYIPTYLAYRELPLLEKLVKDLDNTPTVLMVDANGVLHPFGFGLASHIGVSLNIPTLGVAKKLLCGTVKNNTVFLDGKKRGYVFFQSERVKNPVYVSPGHKISFETSLRIVKHLSDYRIPEPLRQAHIISKKKI